jgi:N-acetyl-beta-hexosaminidase
MPELITVCWANGKPYQPIYGVQGAMEIFNPSEPRVYTTMDGLLREVKDRFPSNYIHLGMRNDYLSNIHFFISISSNLLGMDEVYDPCW